MQLITALGNPSLHDPQLPMALTKSSSKLLWGQKTIAVSIQCIKHILQVLQAEGQLLMEPLKTMQTHWLRSFGARGWSWAHLPKDTWSLAVPEKARGALLHVHCLTIASSLAH